MTGENFCYWLMGKFEIDDKDLVHLSNEEIQIIARHIELVKVHDPANKIAFINFLDYFIKISTFSSSEGWDMNMVNTVKILLNKVFQQHIDPSQGNAEHQAALNAIHQFPINGVPNTQNSNFSPFGDDNTNNSQNELYRC